MGEQKVSRITSQNQMDKFMRHLLNDVQALERMLEGDYFETGIKRIGAEQEVCLVDKYMKPALKGPEILKDFHPDWLTTELAQFNLEANMDPQEFTGSCFQKLEKQKLKKRIVMY